MRISDTEQPLGIWLFVNTTTQKINLVLLGVCR
nr:MAG TPA: dextransucrase [Caudoviricetes sp.]